MLAVRLARGVPDSACRQAARRAKVDTRWKSESPRSSTGSCVSPAPRRRYRPTGARLPATRALRPQGACPIGGARWGGARGQPDDPPTTAGQPPCAALQGHHQAPSQLEQRPRPGLTRPGPAPEDRRRPGRSASGTAQRRPGLGPSRCRRGARASDRHGRSGPARQGGAGFLPAESASSMLRCTRTCARGHSLRVVGGGRRQGAAIATRQSCWDFRASRRPSIGHKASAV